MSSDNQPEHTKCQQNANKKMSGSGVQVDEFRRNGIVLLAKMELDGADVLCTGSLVVCSATLGTGPMLKWFPDNKAGSGDCVGSDGVLCGSLSDREWTVVSERQQRTEGGVAVGGGAPSKLFVRPIVMELSDLKSFRLSEDGNQLTLIQTDGTKHPPLIFLDEGPEALIDVLKRFMGVRPSASDPNLYLLTDARIDRLDQSLSQLNLFDKTHTDAVWKFVNDIKKDPYTTAMSAFSKITDTLIFSPMEEDSRPEEEMADLLQKMGSSSLMNGLQVTTGRREDGEFEVVTPRPRLMDQLPVLERAEPLCQLDWELHFDDRGKIVDLEELQEKIFRGGVEHEIRQEVWKFLLGLHDWNSTAEQRQRSRNVKLDDYYRMKLQWKTITEDQETRFSGFRERKSQIEKDVSRTDRTHPFFQGDANPNVELLQDILMTYVMYDFDLGYVQGMSDLLAPILYVVENEVDAFWCFVGFMSRVSTNFDFDQGGMKIQLEHLADLTKCLDPDFFAYLDTKDSGNLFFCFRWLLIWFKRELPFTDVMRLWEVLWTGLPCRNFHLLVCLALMETERPSIVENRFGFSEILKHINDMSHRIDLNSVLQNAEGIWKKVKERSACHSHPFVGNGARRILGLPEVAGAAALPASESTLPRPHSSSSVEVIDEPSSSPPTRDSSRFKAVSDPVTISGTTGGGDGNRTRFRREEGKGAGSGSSLNDSSSVEAVSEDEEAKLVDRLMFP